MPDDDKKKEITSLEELELANIPEGEIYAVADLLADSVEEDKKWK